MSTLWTAANVFFPDLFYQIRHPETDVPLLKLLVSLKLKNKLQILGFHAIIKKAVIADFLESCWKHMHKETPDKLLVAEGDRTAGITGVSSTGTECCMCIRNRNDSAVRDSNLVGIAPEIFNRITKTIEGLFNIRTPVFLIEGVFKSIPTKELSLPGERRWHS